MEELHERGILHRDIKSSNVLLSSRDEAILSDFGLSRPFRMTPEEQPWTHRDEWIINSDANDFINAQDDVPFGDYTRRNCGTLGYLAPEAFRGGYTYTADLYSAGVVLYEMLNGKVRISLFISGHITHDHIPASLRLGAIQARPVHLLRAHHDESRRGQQRRIR